MKIRFIKNLLLLFIVFILIISCDPGNDDGINDNYNLKITLNKNLKLDLTWDSLTLKSDIKQYEVYKSINKDDNYIKITTLNHDETLKTYKYTDDFTIAGNKTYYYKVRAITLISNEKFSEIESYIADTDIDGDGFIEDDCAANFKNINPGEVEICDGIDNNCNGNIDEGIEDIIVGSDIGECQKGIISCIKGEMKSVQEEIKPIDEICDGKDNNCNNEIDENIDDVITGTDIGECKKGLTRCVNHEMVVIEEEIKPIDEICDGKDNNCNTLIDDGISDIYTGSDIGECQKGIKRCIESELVTIREEIKPKPETCNNLDDNCNTEIDENLFDNCSNVCERGETICIEGHWLGCDASAPHSEDWVTSNPTKRTKFAITNSSNSKAFIFGGQLPTGELSNSLWKYDESGKIWKKIIPSNTAPSPRIYSSITFKASSQELFLYGGRDSENNILDDFWKFDIEEGSWSQLNSSSINLKLYGTTIFSDNFDNIILFGGKSELNINEKTYKYSISQNQWSIINTPVAPEARYHQTMVYSSSTNYLYIFGGKLTNDSISNELWKFNLTTFIWTLESNDSEIQGTIKSSVFIKNSKLYFFGGEKELIDDTLTLYIYDINDKSWSTINSTEDNISSSLVINNQNNTLRIWGGNNNSNIVVNEDIIFDLNNETYILETNLTGIYKTTITYDYIGNRNYLFGGFTENGFSNDLWEYSPIDNSWNKLDLGIKPEPREGATITYNQIDNCLYLYGGRDEVSNYGDLWKLDLSSKTDWENLNLASGPTYRVDAYIFYKDGEIYLFGGKEDTFLIDLYIYDKTENKFIELNYNNNDIKPETRSNYSVIYSSRNDYLFLFGGENNDGVKLDDLWVLDINKMKWITYHIGIEKPTKRDNSKFLYDYANDSVYLFGGINEDNNYLDDLWSLEIGASNWTKIKQNSNYYAFNNRLGLSIFWVNTAIEHYIYVLGGKNDNNYFYLPNKLDISCEQD